MYESTGMQYEYIYIYMYIYVCVYVCVRLIFAWSAPIHGIKTPVSWWCHQMETFSALLVPCAGKSPVTGEFPSKRPVTRSFDVYFDRRLNQQLSKQSRRWWFETPLCSLWRHCNVRAMFFCICIIRVQWICAIYLSISFGIDSLSFE